MKFIRSLPQVNWVASGVYTLAGYKTLDARGNYCYLEDLLELDCRRLIGDKWEAGLLDYPDREFANYITAGIRDGFPIGFDYKKRTDPGNVKNMRSASEHPEPNNEYVGIEQKAGRIIGLRDEFPGIHISRFGVIPKPHQPGKWRLITDLSSPKGNSVNDGVDPALCSVSYASVDDAVKCVPGALLAKLDIASAYRSVPVHPVDRLLLGMRWRGVTMIYGALPFGLRSAPKLFTAVADAFCG